MRNDEKKNPRNVLHLMELKRWDDDDDDENCEDIWNITVDGYAFS